MVITKLNQLRLKCERLYFYFHKWYNLLSNHIKRQQVLHFVKKSLLYFKVLSFFKDNNVKSDFKINSDLSVDVFGSVKLSSKNLYELPFQFGEVRGSFDCSHNNLSSLKNSPKIVRGNFSCKNNNLKDLSFSPKEVHGNYFISENEVDLSEDLCANEVYQNLQEKRYTLIAPWFKSLPETNIENFLVFNRLMISSKDLAGLLEAKALSKRILDFKNNLDWSLNIAKSIPHKPFKI